MREIKFRTITSRNYEDKVKIYQVEMINFVDNQICLKSFESGNCVGFEKLTDCKLLQFTGFKDKNEVEIYEGDIVKYVNKLYTVEFFNGGFFLKCLSELNSDNSELVYGVHFSDDSNIENFCEIVGNIYENKDILKGA